MVVQELHTAMPWKCILEFKNEMEVQSRIKVQSRKFQSGIEWPLWASIQIATAVQTRIDYMYTCHRITHSHC